MATKTTRYTPYTTAQIDYMIASYTAETTDEGRKEAVRKIAEHFERTPTAIIAKLNHEGYYIRPKPTTKRGTPIVKKEEYRKAVEIMLSMPEGALASLEKANKADLELLMKAIVTISDARNLSEGK